MTNPLDRLHKELLAITDPVERAQALTKVFAGIPELQTKLRLARKAVVDELHTDRHMSFGEIGALLGITRGRVKQIFDEQTLSGTKLYPQATSRTDDPGGS